MDDETAEPRLCGIGVRKYKNLRNVWLPWSNGLALFGANGVGKTNLLECMALLLGNRQTLSLAGSRLVTPRPDDLWVVAAPGVHALPWAPDVLLPHGFEADKWARQAQISPAIKRAVSNANWWNLLGVDTGGNFAEAFATLKLVDDA